MLEPLKKISEMSRVRTFNSSLFFGGFLKYTLTMLDGSQNDVRPDGFYIRTRFVPEDATWYEFEVTANNVEGRGCYDKG